MQSSPRRPKRAGWSVKTSERLRACSRIFELQICLSLARELKTLPCLKTYWTPWKWHTPVPRESREAWFGSAKQSALPKVCAVAGRKVSGRGKKLPIADCRFGASQLGKARWKVKDLWGTPLCKTGFLWLDASAVYQANDDWGIQAAKVGDADQASQGEPAKAALASDCQSGSLIGVPAGRLFNN